MVCFEFLHTFTTSIFSSAWSFSHWRERRRMKKNTTANTSRAQENIQKWFMQNEFCESRIIKKSRMFVFFFFFIFWNFFISLVWNLNSYSYDDIFVRWIASSAGTKKKTANELVDTKETLWHWHYTHSVHIYQIIYQDDLHYNALNHAHFPITTQRLAQSI